MANFQNETWVRLILEIGHGSASFWRLDMGQPHSGNWTWVSLILEIGHGSTSFWKLDMGQPHSED